jgi:hypothetical protein
MDVNELKQKFEEVAFRESQKLKIVQITSCTAYNPDTSDSETEVFALAEDGSVWRLFMGYRRDGPEVKRSWTRLPDIIQETDSWM